jgi:serine/threonine protein kinase
MVHRDLKPSNLMLTGDGNIKILDFGLARFASEQAHPGGITPADAVVGTPDYLAPEQAVSPATADIRADIYSLGCTMYHLVTGRVPFPAAGIVPKIMAHQNDTPASAAALRPDVPEALEQALERMMAKDPRQRFQTPTEVIDALNAVQAGQTAKAAHGRRRVAVSWIVGITGGIAALLLLTFILALWRGDRLPEKAIDNINPAPNLDQNEKDDVTSGRTDPSRMEEPALKKKHKKKK